MQSWSTVRTHGRVFLATFLPSAAIVAVLVVERYWVLALGAGVVGLLAYWRASETQTGNGELADASYFFGFLLTLTFLASGLFTLGAAARHPGENVVLGFLEELGAGLVLTILGLLIRQVRTLSPTGRAEAEPPTPLTDAQRQLADAMRALVTALANRPEEIAARELQDTRTRAHTATERLERDVVQAAERIDASMAKLEEAATSVSSALLRTSSGLGASLTQSTERIQIELGAVVALLEAQRHQMEGSLTKHASIDERFNEGLVALGGAAATFHSLAEHVKHEIEALPDPAQGLTGLWDGVRSLEATLASAIAETSRRLNDMSATLERLEHATGTAARSIEQGGSDLGKALHRELAQMNQILEQYTALLERNVGVYSPR
jgi:predicted  nucleic acid-binding Zn-ribbon protein